MILSTAALVSWLPGGGQARPHGPATLSTGYRLPVFDIKLLLVLYVVSRLVLILFSVLSFAANPARMESGLDDIFCNWDCDWYVGIAEGGYVPVPKADKHGVANWAFFPALPTSMWLVSLATGMPVVWAGVLIANIAWGLGLYLFFLLCRDLFGAEFARHGAAIYALWPFAIHASVPMTEALFVPLSIAVIFLARRGDWLFAGLAAACLAATRTVGVLVFIPMFMLAAREFGLWRLLTLRPGVERAAVALGLSGVGLGLYMIHLYGLTGDALAFSHNQNAWNRTFKLPWMMLLDEFNPAYIGPRWLIANTCNALTGLAGICLLPTIWRRGLIFEAIFLAATLGLAFCTGQTNSLPRYTGGLFPVILAVALLTDRPMWRTPAVAAGFAGQAILAFAWALEQFYVM